MGGRLRYCAPMARIATLEGARLSFPLVPAPFEGRAWFLPLAGEYWKAKDRLAARAADADREATRP
jgi:hypothetical protein